MKYYYMELVSVHLRASIEEYCTIPNVSALRSMPRGTYLNYDETFSTVYHLLDIGRRLKR